MRDDDTMDGREIADLLPFYATGTLGAADRARVTAALAVDPALQRELALVAEEHDATITANESIRAPSRQAQDRFFALLNAQAPKPTRFDLAGWVAARLEGLRPRTLGWAACALALVVAAQAGWIGTLTMSAHQGSTFQTASIDMAATPGTGALVIVAFAPRATVADLAKLLADNGASIVAGPLPGGLYKLRIGNHPLSADATGKVVTRLLAQTALVRFAAPGDATPE